MEQYEIDQLDILGIKAHLRIPFVLHAYGHEPSKSTGSRLHYYSPFRHDEHPSFDVFAQTIKGRSEPEERWGDFAEGSNGDVVDLVQRFEGLDRMAAVEVCRGLLRKQHESEWAGPEIKDQQQVSFNAEEAHELYKACRPSGASDALLSVAQSRPGINGYESIPNLRVHPDRPNTLVFFVRDRTDEIVGVRYRTSSGDKFSMRGSRNSLLRLSPVKNEDDRVIVVAEGETDTWAAYQSLEPHRYEILGAPGVGNLPEKLDDGSFEGRKVVIVFDNDNAGVQGARKWAAHLSSVASSVRVAFPPVGKDLAQMEQASIRRLVSSAVAVPLAPEGVLRHNGCWATVEGKDRIEVRSNWSLDPLARLVSEDGALRGFKCLYQPGNEEVIVPLEAFSSAAKLRSWVNEKGGTWRGTIDHIQLVLDLLVNEGAYLPSLPVTDQVGLSRDTIVWPGGSIGPDQVLYLNAVSPVPSSLFRITSASDELLRLMAFEELYDSQAPSATGPMLAWLAVAPLRSKFEQFPALNVSGASGSGKSTLVAEMISCVVGGSWNLTMTSTTPFGIESAFDSSNGFPVWIDEYRPGARAATKLNLDQLLRDAYTGQTSVKGGRNRDNLSELTQIRTMAPIIVSGEDSFTEASHAERMIMVRLTREGQRSLIREVPQGFSEEYYRYLTRAMTPVDGSPVEEAARLLAAMPRDPNLPPRPAYNVQMLRLGWALLAGFLTERLEMDWEMPELDLSEVIKNTADTYNDDPIMELIEAVYSADRMSVWDDGDYLYLNTSSVLSMHQRDFRHIILPVSNNKGLVATLKDRYSGEPVRKRNPLGEQLRVVAIPVDRVPWLAEETANAVRE